MSVDSTTTDPYEVVLNDLRAKKAQIEQAISAIEAIRGGSPMGGNPAHSVTAVPPQSSDIDSPGAFLGMSIADAAKKLLAARRQPMRNPEIAAAFKRGGLVLNSKDVVNTIGAVLSRRAVEVGDLVKVDRGTWGLKEWYPGRSFNKPKSAAPIDTKESSETTVGVKGQEGPSIVLPGFHPQQPTASVPFMITNAMRDKLRENGASEEDIRNMTPAEAQSYIDGFK